MVYYLHGDHLGSTSLTTDQTGNKFSEVRYLPYGQERVIDDTPSPTDFGFTGQRSEAGFGLMDYNARFYSQVLGRFISPDSVVPKVENPQHWNRYSYVYNNPLNLTDPTGHTGCTDGGPSESDVDGGTIPSCSGSNTGGGSHDSHGDGGGGGAGVRNVGQGGGSPGQTPPTSSSTTSGSGGITKASGTTGEQNLVPRSGPKGVDPEHHNANVIVRDANGNVISHERFVSGNMTAEEKALGFPKNTLASHTEARAVRQVPLEKGQSMTITGQRRPCPSCKGYMNRAARESGARIRYQWRQNRETQHWEAIIVE